MELNNQFLQENRSLIDKIGNYVNSTLNSTIETIHQTEEAGYDLILITKVISLLLILGATFFFGFLPLISTGCRRSMKLIGLANAFSGGLFMGIALFHLLPEASESFEKYYEQKDPNSNWKRLPSAFFIAFISYSLILLVEKVAFDSHSITEHDHGVHAHPDHHSHEELALPLLAGHREHERENKTKAVELEPIEEIVKDAYLPPTLKIENEEETPEKSGGGSKLSKGSSLFNMGPPELSKKKSTPLMESSRPKALQKSNLFEELKHHRKHDKGYEEEDEEISSNEEDEEEDEDRDEETMKNVVSSKGKFASYLQARNLMQYSPRNFKADKSLLTASKILERTQDRRYDSIDRNCITNLHIHPLRRKSAPKVILGIEPKESEKVEAIEGVKAEHVHEKQQEKHHFNPKSNLTPYLLMVALSIHGLFEGTALGVQHDLKDALFLSVAIMSHKWAESFTLGLSFAKSSTDKTSYTIMIILFSIFTPLGILLGILVIGADPLTQGIFLAISAGTFLYISASEVIVEEFAITKYRYQKYFLYLCGGCLVGLLSYLEVQNITEE